MVRVSFIVGETISPHGAHVRQAKVFAGVPGVFFSRDFPVFAPPTEWPVSYELK